MYEIIVGRTASDREKFGDRGTIFVGKQFIKMGQTTALSNEVHMDMVRAHVLFIVGKRGCLTGDTKVFTNNGFKNIKDFNEKEDEVYSFNKEDKSFTWEKAELLEYPINNEDLIKFDLHNGHSVIATSEHPLLISKKERMIWKKAQDITKDDNVVGVINVPKSNNIFDLGIKDISKTNGINKVYDLTVPKNHSFIANGIISHNSGKSYTMGVIAEGMADLPDDIKQNLSIIMLDTMGIYWTMKYANKKEAIFLKEWNIDPKALDIRIYTPTMFYKQYKEKGIPTDYPFTIKPNELSATDWCMTFEITATSREGVLLARILNILQEKKPEYGIDDIIELVKADDKSEQHVRFAVENMFENTKMWGVFDVNGTPLKELAKGGQVTVLDVSCYATMPNGWKIKALVVGLISQKLFLERMVSRKDEEFQQVHSALHYFSEEEETKQKFPMVWLVVDEAHELLPREGKTTASDPLITILREGRQPGISLILATQQPAKIHTDVMTQSDIVLSHRITAKMDVEALGLLMQSYMREGLTKQLDDLPREKGAAIIFDDTNERMFPIKVRPRFTWHGGESPIALPEKGKLFDL